MQVYTYPFGQFVFAKIQILCQILKIFFLCMVFVINLFCLVLDILFILMFYLKVCNLLLTLELFFLIQHFSRHRKLSNTINTCLVLLLLFFCNKLLISFLQNISNSVFICIGLVFMGMSFLLKEFL